MREEQNLFDNNDLSQFFQPEHQTNINLRYQNVGFSQLSTYQKVKEIELVPKSLKEIWLIKNCLKMIVDNQMDYTFIYQFGLNLKSIEDIFSYILSIYRTISPKNKKTINKPRNLNNENKVMNSQKIKEKGDPALDIDSDLNHTSGWTAEYQEERNVRKLLSGLTFEDKVGNTCSKNIHQTPDKVRTKNKTNQELLEETQVQSQNSMLKVAYELVDSYQEGRIITDYRQQLKQILCGDSLISRYQEYTINSMLSRTWFIILLFVRILNLKKALFYYELMLSFNEKSQRFYFERTGLRF